MKDQKVKFKRQVSKSFFYSLDFTFLSWWNPPLFLINFRILINVSQLKQSKFFRILASLDGNIKDVGHIFLQILEVSSDIIYRISHKLGPTSKHTIAQGLVYIHDSIKYRSQVLPDSFRSSNICYSIDTQLNIYR